MRRSCFATALAGIALLATPCLGADGVIEINAARASQGGVTTSDTAGVPVTLDAPGSYRLTSDLDASIGPNGATHPDPENRSVIEITAVGVSLDLGGFTIHGPGVAGSGDGIVATPADVAIHGGTIDGVGRDGIAVGGNARIRDCVVVNAGRDAVSTGTNSLVADCTLRDSARYGLHLGAGSGFGGNVLEGNNNDQGQVRGKADGIHEIATNLCESDTNCEGPPDKRVFVYTEQFYDGDLGGVAGADADCAAGAAAGGHSGTFLAWITDHVTFPLSRFTQAEGNYVLPSGTRIAWDFADLVDGTLEAPIDELTTGAPTSKPVWTSVNPAGGPIFTLVSCLGWSDGSGLEIGGTGHTSFSDGRWTDDVTRLCDADGAIYCFEQ